MTLARLNLLSALVSFAAALLWTMLGDVFSGLAWLAVSAGWVALAVLEAGRGKTDPSPRPRLLRRFSRLARWI